MPLFGGTVPVVGGVGGAVTWVPVVGVVPDPVVVVVDEVDCGVTLGVVSVGR